MANESSLPLPPWHRIHIILCPMIAALIKIFFSIRKYILYIALDFLCISTWQLVTLVDYLSVVKTGLMIEGRSSDHWTWFDWWEVVSGIWYSNTKLTWQVRNKLSLHVAFTSKGSTFWCSCTKYTMDGFSSAGSFSIKLHLFLSLRNAPDVPLISSY